MPRVLITGTTGFLGGALARHLHAEGWEVCATGRDAARLAELAALGIATFAADLARPIPREALPRFEGAAVVHAAALTAPWGRAQAFEAANVHSTRTMLSAAETVGAAQFIFISSPSVHTAMADRIALREEAPLPLPINAYAATKAVAERLVRASPLPHRMILRPRGIYGPGDRALLPRMLDAVRRGPVPLLREGQAKTDLTHVGDVTQAIECALNKRPAGCETLHISGGEPLRVTDIIDAASRRAGLAPRWRRVPMPLALGAARGMEWACRLWPGRPEPRLTRYGLALLAYSQTLDISKAERVIGFRPKIRFAEGLETI